MEVIFFGRKSEHLNEVDDLLIVQDLYDGTRDKHNELVGWRSLLIAHNRGRYHSYLFSYFVSNGPGHR